MDLVIRGRNGPGQRCVTDREHEGVHVGLQQGKDPVELRPGDSAETEWRIALDVVESDAGVDFRGPHVQGKKGDRFVYLTWGEVDGKGTFAMFRRAKLKLNAVDPRLIAEAASGTAALVATIELTDERGGPICATPKATHLRWSVE